MHPCLCSFSSSSCPPFSCRLSPHIPPTRGRQHLYYQKLHKQYGDIVRVGPNELSINRADAIAPVLGNSGLPRGVFWHNRFPAGAPNPLVSIRDIAQHKARRRLWDRAFSTASVKSYDELVIRRTRELCEAFEKRSGQVLDFSAWMSFFSYDFMGDFSFGAGFNMIATGSDETGIWECLDAVHLPAACPRHRRTAREVPEDSQRIRGNENPAWKRDERPILPFHTQTFQTDEEGLEPTKPTMPTVFSDSGVAIVAGSDTTSTTLSVLWYFLLVHPEHFRDEALRVVPPVPDGSPRCSPEGSQGRTIDSYCIPPGQQVESLP
ncbi:cytochrome P450 [Athelia psychrophila]|uniref:Cytochrome P450 n=1 Tax=Athelia psychrophila TaxID=1759441 RepID=A0A166P8D1_9AGAM|nr:cytochrome P450 [Fibularhizoctonia sp. CBS 109695]